MRRHLTFGLTLLLALAALVLPPWLAMREARRQAFNAESTLALGYARDVLHRTDETGRQALAGIDALVRSGLPPCSSAARELMREIDLTSTYLQAIGYVREGALVCSSMTGAPVPLGAMSFRSANGIGFYLDVPVRQTFGHPLLAMESKGYAALIHRDLPLDIWTNVPGVSLAIMHLEARYRDIAMRLVPAGLFAGLAAAAAVLLLARQQLSLVAALRTGLRRQQFFLEYQPLIDLRSGHCVGVEALLRWRDGAGELVPPEVFIPVAESSGLIGKLTERVLDLVCADAGHFLASHPNFHVAINLAPADLESNAIVTLLDRMMAKCGALPSNLIVEITERGFVNKEMARAVIAALHARGIEVAVDDFGTGYSSLSYLESLDLDFLKIDRSFIESIGTGAPTSQVVSHIIDMAHNLELRMIAEGIENQEQAAFLRLRGVGYAQGWLFGKPGSFEHAARLHRAALANPRLYLPQPEA